MLRISRFVIGCWEISPLGTFEVCMFQRPTGTLEYSTQNQSNLAVLCTINVAGLSVASWYDLLPRQVSTQARLEGCGMINGVT